MDTIQFNIPESELILSRKTFLENPIGFKATLYGAISLFISILNMALSYLLAIGQIYHADLFVICRMAANGNETFLREPGIALISTKAIFISMPLMIIVFAILSMAFIIKAKINKISTGLFAIAFAFSFFAIILLFVQFQMPVDITYDFFWWAI
jgi:hypothetical protein